MNTGFLGSSKILLIFFCTFFIGSIYSLFGYYKKEKKEKTTCFIFLPKNKGFAYGTNLGNVHLKFSEKGKHKNYLYKAHQGKVLTMISSSKNPLIISFGSDKKIKFINYNEKIFFDYKLDSKIKNLEVFPVNSLNSTIFTLDLNPHEDQLALGINHGGKGFLYILKLNNEIKSIFKNKFEEIPYLKFSAGTFPLYFGQNKIYSSLHPFFGGYLLSIDSKMVQKAVIPLCGQIETIFPFGDILIVGCKNNAGVRFEKILFFYPLWVKNSQEKLEELRFPKLTGEDIVPFFISPDGRMIASAERGKIFVWEVITGQKIIAKNFGEVIKSIEFSPDGKKIGFLTSRGNIKIWNLPFNNEPESFEKLWIKLGEPSGLGGYKAVCQFSLNPGPSVEFLKKHLSFTPMRKNQEEIKKIVKKLGEFSFQEREKASNELEKLGNDAQKEIWIEYEKTIDPEIKARLKNLLKPIPKWIVNNQDTLRKVRAVWALQKIGNFKVRELLKQYAKGPPLDRLTMEAVGTLEILNRTSCKEK